jgi:general secretion pathway protein A
MFEKHFHFQTQPFAEHTPAERLWPDDRLTQGLARVRYLTAAGTLGLVTGASGVGKSALLKRVWHELRGPGIQVYYLHLAHLSSNDLLRLLVRTLGETPLWSKDQLLGQIRDRAQQVDGTLLVLLDEAHLLKAETLTDLRLLVSSALDDQPPLKLVLAGQPPLLELLRRHRDVLDRITVRYHLHPLSKPQTAAYLDFHVRTAGGTDGLFTPTVKDLIHDYSGGVPRQINNLATACLLQAAVQNAARVDEALLQQTLSEFHLP